MLLRTTLNIKLITVTDERQMTANTHASAGAEWAETLPAIVTAVMSELRPGRAAPVTLDASLDRDLGLDSLARVELASRIEATFGISLGEEVLAGAETVRDLLDAMLASRGVAVSAVAPETGPVQTAGSAAGAVPPAELATLTDVLAWHAARHPGRLHLRLYTDEDDGVQLSYGALLEEARAVACGLQAASIAPGDPVALMLGTGRDYFTAFFGVLLAGGICVPVYPPTRAQHMLEHVRRLAGILDNAYARALIVPGEAEPLARTLHAQVRSLRDVATVEGLSSRGGALQAVPAGPDEPALLQYTSGSTGAPKGVTLTHANLLANIRAMAEALDVRRDDVFVSWLPLYHDMGLIGGWLGSLHQAVPLILMSPLAFLARPARWPRAITRYRGSISGGPNFAYDLICRHVRDEDLASLDLSSWRVAFNGAEPVSAATIERVCERFARAGLRRQAIAPVYGLAENCVGLAFPPLGRGPLIDTIRREELARSGRAIPTDLSDPDAMRLVACGQPLAGHDVRVVDAAGFELPERREGRLQFRGPSATRGYWRNEEATRLLLDGDWRETGDLAYIADGDLYVTARIKDLIIRGGRNIHPTDIEAGVATIEGILPGRIAAFGDAGDGNGSERLIVVAETRKRAAPELEALRADINGRVAEIIGAPPDDVVLAPPNAIPRTSSGKIRRRACRALWRAGQIGAGTSPGWHQTLRLAGATLVGRVRRGLSASARLAFAAWAWSATVVLSPPAWLGALLLPKLSWRWKALRWASRTLFFLTGIPITARGAEQLADRPCVLVANHASYLDVLALVATLPRPVAFVAKAELRSAWYTRLPLERIGCAFVERFDRKRGLDDYRRIAAAAREGLSPLFFPEGTFRRAPGLMSFRMGAFACAVEADLPVVPIVLRGTRCILTSGSWFPRHGRIDVILTPPLIADAPDERWQAALSLRDRVRAAMLPLTGERDAADARPLVKAMPAPIA
jgi:1-acyl-sn-glycerol-3-phosphate acyltransferase